jgi:hypothetical protein
MAMHTCPFCEVVSRSKAGLSLHVRQRHAAGAEAWRAMGSPSEEEWSTRHDDAWTVALADPDPDLPPAAFAGGQSDASAPPADDTGNGATLVALLWALRSLLGTNRQAWERLHARMQPFVSAGQVPADKGRFRFPCCAEEGAAWSPDAAKEIALICSRAGIKRSDLALDRVPRTIQDYLSHAMGVGRNAHVRRAALAWQSCRQSLNKDFRDMVTSAVASATADVVAALQGTDERGQRAGRAARAVNEELVDLFDF